MLLDQIEILVSQSNFSRSDVLKMPVYERTHYINRLVQRREREEEAMNEAKSGKK